MKKLPWKWTIVAIVVLALLAGAYVIVERRNQRFYSSGQETTSAPMH